MLKITVTESSDWVWQKLNYIILLEIYKVTGDNDISVKKQIVSPVNS